MTTPPQSKCDNEKTKEMENLSSESFIFFTIILYIFSRFSCSGKFPWGALRKLHNGVTSDDTKAQPPFDKDVFKVS